MKITKKLTCWLGALALTFLPLVASSSVFANELPARRLVISPSRLELDLKPGTTVEETVKVYNTGTEALEYKMSVVPYSVNGDDYEQDFVTKSDYTDIAGWVTFSKESGELGPDESNEIKVTVKVPKDIPSGGQYAAVIARMTNGGDAGDDGTGVNVYSEVGAVIYATNIDGNTRKEGSVVENKVPSFMFAPPISTTSIVENTGNVHADASYILQVYPFVGSEEVYTNEENPTILKVLPGTRRLNTMTWEGAPQLGIFRIKQTVKFLGQESVTEKVLFICPIWFMLIILVLIFLVIFWIVTRARGRKEE